MTHYRYVQASHLEKFDQAGGVDGMDRLKWRLVRAGGVTLSLLCGISLSGCAIFTAINNDIVEALEKEPAPSNQAQAASAHVAVIAVARWDEYVKDIQPVFAIDTASALRDAIPATASFRSRLVDATRLGVQVGLPTSGTVATETTTTDAAEVATTTSEETTSSTPGATPQSPGFLGTVQNSANQSYLQQSLDQDPFLKYSIASDLYQEVKILNRVLSNANIRDEVEPYFVRLKVALLPYRRELEFDAYSDINFFLRRQPLDQTNANIELQKLPIVVPLLVTDSLESATDAASAQFISELAAAISGASQGVAFGGQLQALNDRLTEALANERNSLRTVARLGENAIRVRFGATLQAGPTGRKDYELLPRTHTVSLLVLVPRSAIAGTEESVPLGIVSRTVLKDVRRGEQLELGATREFKARVQAIADGYNVKRRLKQGANKCPFFKMTEEKTLHEEAYDWVNSLRFKYVVFGDYTSYQNEAYCVFTEGRWKGPKSTSDQQLELAEATPDVEGLWLELQSFAGDYAVQGQMVDLPAITWPVLPNSSYTVILTDDGKSISVGRIPGGKSLNTAALRVDLCVAGPGGPCSERLAATSIAVDTSGITATFPSLKGLGLVQQAKPSVLSNFSISLQHARPPTDTRPCACAAPERPYEVNFAHLRYVPGPAAMPKQAAVKADIAASQIVSIAGEGKLTVGVALDAGEPPRSAYVRVAGAEVDSAAGGELSALGFVKLGASGRVELTLRNLAVGSKVSVTVGLLEGSKENVQTTKELTVVEVQPLRPDTN